MKRVLRPGGMAAILEFSQPPNPDLQCVVWLLLAQHSAPHRRADLRSLGRLHLPPRSVRKFPDAPGLAAEDDIGRVTPSILRAHDVRDRRAAYWAVRDRLRLDASLSAAAMQSISILHIAWQASDLHSGACRRIDGEIAAINFVHPCEIINVL